ncbi:hypothetical protein [Streptomyces malaysiense]|uniref:Lipoprotein n=1 Tax=Streptomyces malaysiense TaxID=1428626 RepID=A0A1J4Q1M9_9ACTN|nr:hypothetical protein [Streptomyces malaysiense]OIK26914.1 hypothetical protein VT52_013910 [Streptomyces malaysiense]
MRIRVAARVPAVAAIAVCGLLLTGCNDDSGAGADSASSPAPTASATAGGSAPAASPSRSAAGDGGAAAGTAVPVNKTIDDEVMGEKATVVKYVEDFQPSAAAKAKFPALADEKVVLVDVAVTASSKYYDSFGASSFYLTGMPNGIDQASTTILDDEIKAAGYPPLEDAETGKTSTGWVVFTPTKDADKLVLRYKRLAAKASDGTEITAKNFDVPLG